MPRGWGGYLLCHLQEAIPARLFTGKEGKLGLCVTDNGEGGGNSELCEDALRAEGLITIARETTGVLCHKPLIHFARCEFFTFF